jgi:quinol monooxygenase YgiN
VSSVVRFSRTLNYGGHRDSRRNATESEALKRIFMPKFAMFAKVIAKPGQRDAILEILLAASRQPMSGCDMYIVSTAPSEPDSVYVYEAWRTQADHDSSLAIESVKALVEKAKPLIAGFEGVKLDVIGGKGLPHT